METCASIRSKYIFPLISVKILIPYWPTFVDRHESSRTRHRVLAMAALDKNWTNAQPSLLFESTEKAA